MQEEQSKIDHLKHPFAEWIRALLSREERTARQEMIIDDEENIKEALKANIKLEGVFVTDNVELSKEMRALLHGKTAIHSIAVRTCKKIFNNERLSRVFAIARLPDTFPLSALKKDAGDLIIVNELSISGNIGAIIRTAFAFNIGGIISLDQERIDFYDRRIIRASRGYLFRVPVITMKSKEFIHFCKENGIKILVLSPHATCSLKEIAFRRERLATIMGRERDGCTDELIKEADLQARIPINPHVESLNVSVAAGIFLYLRNLYLNKELSDHPSHAVPYNMSLGDLIDV